MSQAKKSATQILIVTAAAVAVISAFLGCTGKTKKSEQQPDANAQTQSEPTTDIDETTSGAAGDGASVSPVPGEGFPSSAENAQGVEDGTRDAEQRLKDAGFSTDEAAAADRKPAAEDEAVVVQPGGTGKKQPANLGAGSAGRAR